MKKYLFLLLLAPLAAQAETLPSTQYNTARDYNFEIYDPSDGQFINSVSFTTGDCASSACCEVVIDGAAPVDCDNQPTALTGGGYNITISAAELSAEHVRVRLSDAATTKRFLPKSLNVATYGNASAWYPETEIDANVVSLEDNTITAGVVASNAIGADEIATNAIGANEIEDGAIGAPEIEANAIGVSEVNGICLSTDLATVDGNVDDIETIVNNFTFDGSNVRAYVEEIADAATGSLGVITDAVDTGATSTTFSVKNTTLGDGNFVGSLVVVLANGGLDIQMRRVIDYTTGVMTVDEAFSTTPSEDDAVRIQFGSPTLVGGLTEDALADFYEVDLDVGLEDIVEGSVMDLNVLLDEGERAIETDATAVTASTITIAAGPDSDDALNGWMLMVDDDSDSSDFTSTQTRLITDYVGSTGVITVSPDFSPAVTTDDTFYLKPQTYLGVEDLTANALAKYFTVNSGTTFDPLNPVEGSVVGEIGAISSLGKIYLTGFENTSTTTVLQFGSGDIGIDNLVIGSTIYFLVGPAAAQSATIISADSGNDTVTIDPPVSTAPDDTSIAVVLIDSPKLVNGMTVRALDNFHNVQANFELDTIADGSFMDGVKFLSAVKGIDVGVTAVGASTFTMADGPDNDDALIGWSVVVADDTDTSGDFPVVQGRVITDYDAGTQVATVEPAWAPSVTTSDDFYLQPDSAKLVEKLSTTATAQVNTEADTALSDYDAPTDTEMVAAFTEIKGAGWDSGTDTLEDIKDASGGSGGDSSADIYTYFTSSSREDAFKADLSTVEGKVDTIDGIVDTIAAAVVVIDGIVDDILTDTSTTLDAAIAAVKSVVDSILVDTDTTIPATISTVEGKIDTVDTNVDSVLDDTGTSGVTVSELKASALADAFNTNSGTVYGSAVAGSLVKEVADNAGGTSLTAEGIADAVMDEALSGHTTAGTAGKALSDAAAGGGGGGATGSTY